MKRVFLLLPMLAVVGAVGAAPPPMKPGLWEMTMSAEMQGMPGGMPATKLQHCYKAEDLKDLRETVPKQTNSKCHVRDWKQSGNTITYTMSCEGSTAMTMTGNMTYASDHYSGSAKISMNQGGQTMNVTQKFNARRLGDCKK
jgi:hypothetical protein